MIQIRNLVLMTCIFIRLYSCGFNPIKQEKAIQGFGAPSGIRTRDPLIKSQLLYQLS